MKGVNSIFFPLLSKSQYHQYGIDTLQDGGYLYFKYLSTQTNYFMATIKGMKRETLIEWIDNHQRNMDLPIVTKSILLGRRDLEQIVTELKKVNADGVRIYLIRFKRNDPNYAYTNGPEAKNYIEFVGRDLTQLSIAIVPTTNYAETNKGGYVYSSADDLLDANKALTVFVTGGENTGLCPPNCKGSSGGGGGQ
jgi:hypothetical protein